MTVNELIGHLQKYPENAEVSYLHNIYGVISVNEIESKECVALSGNKIQMIILSGEKESDQNEKEE